MKASECMREEEDEEDEEVLVEEEFVQNRTRARRDSYRDGTNTLSRNAEEEEIIWSLQWARRFQRCS